MIHTIFLLLYILFAFCMYLTSICLILKILFDGESCIESLSEYSFLTELGIIVGNVFLAFIIAYLTTKGFYLFF